jgi:hypothetical protein
MRLCFSADDLDGALDLIALETSTRVNDAGNRVADGRGVFFARPARRYPHQDGGAFIAEALSNGAADAVPAPVTIAILSLRFIGGSPNSVLHV